MATFLEDGLRGYRNLGYLVVVDTHKAAMADYNIIFAINGNRDIGFHLGNSRFMCQFQITSKNSRDIVAMIERNVQYEINTSHLRHFKGFFMARIAVKREIP